METISVTSQNGDWEGSRNGWAGSGNVNVMSGNVSGMRGTRVTGGKGENPTITMTGGLFIGIIIFISVILIIIFSVVYGEEKPPASNMTQYTTNNSELVGNYGGTTRPNGFVTETAGHRSGSTLSQYFCNIKQNAFWRDGRCNCFSGFYGNNCNMEKFDSGYTALGNVTLDNLNSDKLKIPGVTGKSFTEGSCSRICDEDKDCVGFWYNKGVSRRMVGNNDTEMVITEIIRSDDRKKQIRTECFEKNKECESSKSCLSETSCNCSESSETCETCECSESSRSCLSEACESSKSCECNGCNERECESEDTTNKECYILYGPVKVTNLSYDLETDSNLYLKDPKSLSHEDRIVLSVNGIKRPWLRSTGFTQVTQLNVPSKINLTNMENIQYNGPDNVVGIFSNSEIPRNITNDILQDLIRSSGVYLHRPRLSDLEIPLDLRSNSINFMYLNEDEYNQISSC